MFLEEWGTTSMNGQHETYDHLAMVVVEGDVFTKPKAVKLVATYERRKKQRTESLYMRD